MSVNGFHRLATLEQVDVAFSRLAAARKLAGDLDPFSAEASIVDAGLDILAELLCGVRTLAENAEAVAMLSGRGHLSGMTNECSLEIS